MATKAKLEQAAKAFNDLMKLDPQIKTGRRVKMDAILTDIKEAAEMLRPEDQFPKEIVDTLVEVNVFVKDEAKTRTLPTKPKPTPKDKAAKGDNGDKPFTKKNKTPVGVEIVHLLCDNPDISNESIKKHLDKKKFTYSPSTISTQKGDTMKVINYLKEQNRWMDA